MMQVYAEEYGSKNLDEHKKEHQKFVNKVSEFHNEMKLKKKEITKNVF